MKIFQIVLVFSVFVIGAYSCQKDNLLTDVVHNQDPDMNWGQGDSIPIVAPFYFQGKIDSLLYTLQDSITGYNNLVFDSTYVNCFLTDTSDTNFFYGQLTGMYTLDGRGSLEIKFLRCIDDTAVAADKESLIFVGTHSYGSSDIFAPVDGVEITWVDMNGSVWKSLPGSGNSQNNSFEILSITPDTSNVLGDVRILGSMDVTLYNTTKSIRIESGEFLFQYGVY